MTYRWDDNDYPGPSRSQANLAYWSNRASENSRVARRARSGEMRLPDTGGKAQLHSTSSPPRRED